jgi:hypothetical protein
MSDVLLKDPSSTPADSSGEPAIDPVEDCRLMLEFALAEGKAIGAELAHQIAVLDRELIRANKEGISRLPAALVIGTPPPAGGNGDTGYETPLELLLGVHGALSVLVSPATAHSLRATRRDRGWTMRHFHMPILTFLAILAALICMIGFFLTLPRPNQPPPAALSTVDGDTTK